MSKTRNAPRQKRPPGRPKRGPHIFERSGRFYADVRDFAAVLEDHERSGRIALKEEDAKLATTDPEIAQVLFARKLKELRERSRTRVATGRWRSAKLGAYAKRHLILKAKTGKNVERWLSSVQRHLQEAVTFFGKDTDIAAITTQDVSHYVEHLARLGNGRKAPDGQEGKLTAATQRKFLNSLSNLYRRAASEGHVAPGLNPVAALMDKPVAEQREAAWLEVPDAALLLEACRTYKPNTSGPAEPVPADLLHAIVAMFLLTGGRTSEVLGLTVGDVSFERGRITFRTHPHRRLKTRMSARSVPLWPQLREVLVPYVASLRDASDGALLFPSPRTGRMFTDGLRKALDAAAGRVGWQPGEIRTKAFRHSYCAARLQTATRVLRTGPDGNDVVQWIPVGRDEVARELGHGGTSLVARVYGHLGESKHRGEFPEYRIEQHHERLAARLRLIKQAA